MDYRPWHWRVKDRELFITVLTETGNPGVAAAAIGQTLAAAYRMRDRWPALAEEWQRALAIAWEQVEMRMLSTLLDGEATEINARVALEMLKRRKAPVERPLLTISAATIDRVRSDIRALAAPQD
jgi:hypothetical protein